MYSDILVKFEFKMHMIGKFSTLNQPIVPNNFMEVNFPGL